MKAWVCGMLLALQLVAGLTHAQAIEPLPFRNHTEQQRFQHLTAVLRCPMCQNESLADSNAPIARDLRNQIFRQMQQGRSDRQIKQFLVDRYSDYVLYNPPLKAATWLLWFGPLLLLLAGAAAITVFVRKRAASGDNTSIDDGDDW